MKLIKPSYKILEQENGIEGIYKQIEKAGRVCYKSEDKIGEGTAKPFVDRLINSKHLAVLEHGTVFLMLPVRYWKDSDGNEKLDTFNSRYDYDPYSESLYVTITLSDLSSYPFIPSTIINECYDGEQVTIECVTTNYRVIIENGWTDDLRYMCEPTEFHEKRLTVHFTGDIGVMREFFRHRTMSMCQESTRYCDYSKGKYGNQITYIMPPWCEHDITGEYNTIYEIEDKDFTVAEKRFLEGLLGSEAAYMTLLQKEWTAQQARGVLPLATKGEAVMTGFIHDWANFFNQRTSFLATTGMPHPQASELADPLYKEVVDKKIVARHYNGI